MGKSLKSGKDQIAPYIKNKKPKRILDLGAGSGTYLKLMKHEHNTCLRAEWVAVEAWQPYIEQFELEKLYNKVINADVRTLDLKPYGKFDIAIAGDVLEHMSKEEAMLVVENVLKHTKELIISIPIVYMQQDELDGNPFEVHVKPDWTHEEVMETWKSHIFKDYRKSSKSKIGVYWLHA